MVLWSRAQQGKRYGWLPGSVAACLLSVSLAWAAQPPIPPSKPSARILVEPLGFVPPAHFFMPYRIPSVTLDFLDSTHLLFTFHTAKLMHREADDPKDDQDQLIRALVLSVPEGKVESEGDWRLHDRERYLWMLEGGRFLVRKRDTLYLGDKTLVLSPYLHPEGALTSVQLSPDSSTLLAEFAKPIETNEVDAGDSRPTKAPTLGGPTLGSSPSSSQTSGGAPLGDAAPDFHDRLKQYTLLVVDTRERTATRMARLRQPLVFPMVDGGYLGVQQGKGKQWNVSLSAFGGEPHVVASVASTCQPSVASLSQHAFLVQACLPYSSDRLVDAFDLHGNKLWEQLWQSRFTWGAFAYSAAGNRFAYGSIEVNHSLAPLDPVDEASIVGQPVGIFSVETGKPDAVLDANPILSAGENFALSPDGDKLAILRNGAIELYDLPHIAAPHIAASASAAPVSTSAGTSR